MAIWPDPSRHGSLNQTCSRVSLFLRKQPKLPPHPFQQAYDDSLRWSDIEGIPCNNPVIYRGAVNLIQQPQIRRAYSHPSKLKSPVSGKTNAKQMRISSMAEAISILPRLKHQLCRAAAAANCSCWSRSSSSKVIPLCSNLFDFFSRPYVWSADRTTRGQTARGIAYLLDFLVFCCRLEHCRDIFREAEVFQGLGDMVAGDRLFCLLLRDLVCLRGDEGDELDAAFNEQISSLLRECDTA